MGPFGILAVSEGIRQASLGPASDTGLVAVIAVSAISVKLLEKSLLKAFLSIGRLRFKRDQQKGTTKIDISRQTQETPGQNPKENEEKP